MTLLDPAGDVAVQQRDVLVTSTLLMLLIIIPVIALVVGFAWHYRQSNKKATYKPNWDHSILLELVIWSGPLLIIICLGALTWLGTHLLDPYRPIGRISPDQQIAATEKPLDIDVVALDWKWLFFYPDSQVASVNELVVPVGKPLAFHITAATVMNSFFVPAMAGQIYAMAGMETQLSAVMNKPGSYEGFSANYSGAGFSDMHFVVHAVDGDGFNAWVGKVKREGAFLDRDLYRTLAAPSIKDPVRYYSGFEPGLYDAILNMCTQPGQRCMKDMVSVMHGGEEGAKLMPAPEGAQPHTPFGPVKTYVMSNGTSHPTMIKGREESRPEDSTPLKGVGLEQPYNQKNTGL